MKATGVIRRIDELGRIVIPKEIRRNLKIRDGENMEIFIDYDSIILKKYSKLDDILIFIQKLTDKIGQLMNLNVIITDRDKIVCSSQNINLNNNEIGKELLKCIEQRLGGIKKDIILNNDLKISGESYVSVIINSSDVIGLVIINNQNESNDNSKLIAELMNYIIVQSVDIN